MICSASQIDSFWKTLVLSNDCESSMRAMVIEPPRWGVAAEVDVPFPPANAAAAPAAASRARARIMSGLPAFTVTPSNEGTPAVFCIQHTAHLAMDYTDPPLVLVADDEPPHPAEHKLLSRTVADWLAER